MNRLDMPSKFDERLPDGTSTPMTGIESADPWDTLHPLLAANVSPVPREEVKPMHRSHMTSRAPRRLLLAGAVLALALTPPSSALAASSNGTVLICEATGNPSAPYVEIRVSQSNLGDYGSAQGDIIPAPPGGCPSSVSGSSAPVETGSTTATVSASATSSAASAPAPAPAPAPRPHHGSHPNAGGGVKGSSGKTVGTLPSAPRLSSTNPLKREPTSTSALHELPRTGGEVPLTLLIATCMLAAAAALPLARRMRGRG